MVLYCDVFWVGGVGVCVGYDVGFDCCEGFFVWEWIWVCEGCGLSFGGFGFVVEEFMEEIYGCGC